MRQSKQSESNLGYDVMRNRCVKYFHPQDLTLAITGSAAVPTQAVWARVASAAADKT